MSDIRENVSLKNLTTFRCGGQARYFVEPASESDIIDSLNFARDNNLEVLILGLGSNMLISDKGFDGLVIRIGKNLNEITWEDMGDYVIVEAMAGASLASFGNKCTELGLEGAEFSCGIPGTVGGGVFMNAGAYGGEMKDLAISARYIDDGEVREISGENLNFGYRQSVFEQMQKAGKNPVIVSFKAKIKKASDPEEVRAKVQLLREKRTSSQPLDVPSAGSTFKRPEGYFAGKLIEDAGLKGFKLDESGAQVSPKHSGFVVNNGGTATASDVYKLICYVSDTVFEKDGVRLEPEVRLIGDFS